MKRPTISTMTLRQKIGQTGMPSPRAFYEGVKRCGGYDKYFVEVPFTGLYLGGKMWDHTRTHVIPTPEELTKLLREASEASEIPLLVTCDAEHGARSLFSDLHRIPTMMSVGAAASKELAYKRSYYYAKELKYCGVNWAFSPNCDLVSNFFSMGVRTMSDQPDISVELLPDILRGYRDAGVAATAKHFPGRKGDYRDSHICTSSNTLTREKWDELYKVIYKTAVDAGVESIMVSHASFPAVDPSYARGKAPRPSSASAMVIDILRKELNFEGVILTDAVSMKGIASAFERDDMYIECFNAGNDLILFCHDDYIDIMEKAVLDGRVSMQRLDESVERILHLKEKLGLFEKNEVAPPLTPEENREFEQINYELAKKALTLLNNDNNMIPFSPESVKKAAIIKLSDDEAFTKELEVMVQAFEDRGIETTVLDHLDSKDHLKELSKENDIIVYACLFDGINCQQPMIRKTLFDGLSFGAEKSVVASFGTPALYYNYFESVPAYVNAYSSDAGTMKAFVDGILGDFTITGKSPVELRPKFQD